jgi:hypothetical protein
LGERTRMLRAQMLIAAPLKENVAAAKREQSPQKGGAWQAGP